MAEHLKSLFEAGITERRLFGLSAQQKPQQLRTALARAVDIFMGYDGTPV